MRYPFRIQQSQAREFSARIRLGKKKFKSCATNKFLVYTRCASSRLRAKVIIVIIREVFSPVITMPVKYVKTDSKIKANDESEVKSCNWPPVTGKLPFMQVSFNLFPNFNRKYSTVDLHMIFYTFFEPSACHHMQLSPNYNQARFQKRKSSTRRVVSCRQ